tara:strand:+ start:1282 stop:2031 length:750 start_codon:yes stop_codon:yes gene_type:complete
MDITKTRYFTTKVGAGSLHKKPSFFSDCVTETVYGDSNEILKYHKEWIFIECEDGYKGWINKFYGLVTEKKNNPKYFVVYPRENGLFDPNFPFGSKVKKKIEGTVSISKIIGLDNIINVGSNLLNIPYKWGGKTSLGFDCSGLVQAVFKVCGYKLPRDSCQQRKFLLDCQIELEKSQPGDLHFFGKKGKTTHVAISTGRFGILHSQGFVKKESLGFDDDNFNKKLLDLYISTHSIGLKFESEKPLRKHE